MTIKCPKCGHIRSDKDDPLIPDYQCPACDVVYKKYLSEEAKAVKLERIAQAKRAEIAERREKRGRELSAVKAFISRYHVIILTITLLPFVRLGGNATALVLALLMSLWVYSQIRARRTNGHSKLQFAKSKSTYEIKYIDEIGQSTQRAITVRKVYRNASNAYINAFCHLRGEERTFMMSRIVGDMRNNETGETISPYELLPGFHEQDAAKKDAWEEFHGEIDEPLKLIATLHFDYIDTRGNKTQRTVDIKQFGYSQEGVKIYGFCHLRHGNRAFRIVNIKNCVEVETGEIIKNVQQFLEDRYRATPEYTIDALLKNHEDIILILLFVAAADGRVAKAELTVIKTFLQRLCNDPHITEELVKKVFKALQPPTATQFSKLVSKLKNKESVLKAEILEASKAIVATQKTVYPVEQFALDLMKNNF